MATVTCLLSGVRLFDEASEDRYRSTVKGTHALQVYASVYWVDYLLCIFQSPVDVHETSKLHTLLDLLCTELDRFCTDQDQTDDSEELAPESQLACLERYEKIHKVVKQTIHARSLRNLEERLRLGNGEYPDN